MLEVGSVGLGYGCRRLKSLLSCCDLGELMKKEIGRYNVVRSERWNAAVVLTTFSRLRHCLSPTSPLTTLSSPQPLHVA